ncbi:MAG: hydroxymethylglutaryl-CoA lyase [Flavobacteriia bacterium]|jgi:hydroxymethylglutaryl-CoA lyase|nr:hydroxymethylglutaryl-CoA lyase [Flavobacteriia bacterium]
MQGISQFIPTEEKIDYLNSLLKCGFNRLDFGSFVSPKAIPQLRDTAEVLQHLQLSGHTKLLAIVANEKGVEQGVGFEQIEFFGYPFSISEQFQLRNTNAGINASKIRLKNIASIIQQARKSLVVYLSMGFGNPYGDPWSTSMVVDYAKELHETFGVSHFALSDTIGCANPQQLNDVFVKVSEQLPSLEIGVHLHTVPDNARSLITSALDAGCRFFDTALLGKGGCPMAKDELTGNLSTEDLQAICSEDGWSSPINLEAFVHAKAQASVLFNKYH